MTKKGSIINSFIATIENFHNFLNLLARIFYLFYLSVLFHSNNDIFFQILWNLIHVLFISICTPFSCRSK